MKDSRKSYQETGYWLGPKLFDNHIVAQLRDACSLVFCGVVDEPKSPHFLIDATQPVGGLRRAFNASFVNVAIRAAIHNSRIGEIANQALKIDPGLASAYVHRASVFERKGDMERARADREQVIRLGGPSLLQPDGR